MWGIKVLLYSLSIIQIGLCLELRNGAYEGFVITISDNVPVEHCKTILHNLEVTKYAVYYLFF